MLLALDAIFILPLLKEVGIDFQEKSRRWTATNLYI
jgi:hypothetical protein